MFLELIATFVAGIAAAGVVMLLNRITGGHFPKWVMPVGAGAAMISFTIWNEYNWYDHTRGNLPEGIEVVSTVEKRAIYRPWTYLRPYVSRFVAVDKATILRNEQAPDHRIVSAVFMGRWSPVRQVRMLVDCANGRRVDLVDGLDLGADGLPTNAAAWIGMEMDNPLLISACQET